MSKNPNSDFQKVVETIYNLYISGFFSKKIHIGTLILVILAQKKLKITEFSLKNHIKTCYVETGFLSFENNYLENTTKEE